MIKKIKPIEIDKEDIFKNDTMNREGTIKDLSKLIVSNTDPFVLTVNGSWGSGKTVFVKLWREHLKKEYDMDSIYFSAWEDDFIKDPLISILGEINSYIEEKYTSNSEISKKFKNAVKISGKILTRVVPQIAKLATCGIVDLEKDYETAMGVIAEQTSKHLIENYAVEKNILEKLKNQLSLIFQEMSSENVGESEDNKKTNKPFIIFIDELDRCRPLYAIELLERIKHIFGIENLTFVLSIDKSQLSESIKSQYGNIDTDNYLRRFIDLEFNLPNTSFDNFCDDLFRKFKLGEIILFKGVKTNFSDEYNLGLIKKLSIILSLSLRQIEHVFTRLSIIFKTMQKNMKEEHFTVFVFFTMLRVFKQSIYEDLINRQIDVSKVKKLYQNLLPDSTDLKILLDAIVDSTSLTKEEYYQLVNKTKENFEKQVEKTEEYYVYDKLYHFLNWPPSNNYKLNSVIQTVIKKIEFADRFHFDEEVKK